LLSFGVLGIWLSVKCQTCRPLFRPLTLGYLGDVLSAEEGFIVLGVQRSFQQI
jgi:hypothetical protein